MRCHPDPALREKDLLFFAPREEVEDYCYGEGPLALRLIVRRQQLFQADKSEAGFHGAIQDGGQRLHGPRPVHSFWGIDIAAIMEQDDGSRAQSFQCFAHDSFRLELPVIPGV